MTFEPLKGLRTHHGPIWELFWLDLAAIFMIFQAISARESACALAFAKVCITCSALFPAQLPTGLVAVWASPTGYMVNLAERKLPQITTRATVPGEQAEPPVFERQGEVVAPDVEAGSS